jgi:hypothetical protein
MDTAEKYQMENVYLREHVATDEEKDMKAEIINIQSALEHSKLGGYIPLTPEEKHRSRALNRKFDCFVLPFCVGIYLLNGLDRSNLGNAATNNFTQDLGIPASTVNTASSLFFCTVCFLVSTLSLFQPCPCSY